MLKFGFLFSVVAGSMTAMVACTNSADLGGGAAQDSGPGADGATGNDNGQTDSGGCVPQTLCVSKENVDDGGACGELQHHDGLVGPGGEPGVSPLGHRSPGSRSSIRAPASLSNR